VRALGVVELQGAGERLQDAVGDAAGVSALQALVVLEADAGQRGDLLAAQSLHAAGPVRGQADLVRGDLRPAGGEELGDVVGGVHAIEGTPAAAGQGGPVNTPLTGPPKVRESALT
jgi:hypothetical protein